MNSCFIPSKFWFSRVWDFRTLLWHLQNLMFALGIYPVIFKWLISRVFVFFSWNKALDDKFYIISKTMYLFHASLLVFSILTLLIKKKNKSWNLSCYALALPTLSCSLFLLWPLQHFTIANCTLRNSQEMLQLLLPIQVTTACIHTPCSSI